MSTRTKTALSSVSMIRGRADAGVRRVYDKFVRPRSTGDDARRHELILNVVLLGSIALVGASDLSLLYSWFAYAHRGNSVAFPVFSLLLAFLVGLYVMSRRGYTRFPAYAVVCFYLITSGYASYRWGVSLPPALLAYALIIFVSSVMIGNRFGLGIMLVIFTGLVLIGQHEINQGILQAWRLKQVTIADVNIYTAIFLIIALISWLSNHETERSLRRARKSERLLEEKNESLEQTVLERTAELKRVQAEKVSQLYRFAEFGRLSSGIFHDLMNPLAAVTAGVAGLGAHPEAPELKESLDRAMSAGRRLESFLGTVRKQLRADSAQEMFSLNAEIEEIVSLLSYKAQKAGVALEFSAAEEVKTFGNALKFAQMAVNLVSNAIDAYESVPKNDQKSEGRERCVKILLRRKHGTIFLSVSDFGCGIPDSVVGSVFDPFFSTKDRHKGIGLGLSTTKDIVERDFGGTASVRSVEGKGTRFDLVFPEQHAHG